MLATHIFSKTIRSRITLPYQWVNTIVNVARLNSSSSSSSSDSSSDSDADPESSNQNIGRGSKNIARLTNNYLSEEKKRNVDYLQSRNEAHKKRQIQKHIIEAAQTLTEKNVNNREHIVSRLINRIGNIENKDKHSVMNKIDEYKEVVEKKHKRRYAKQKYAAENANQEINTQYHEQKSHVSNRILLQNVQKRKDVSKKITEKDRDVERGLSTIHMLDVQQKRKDVNNKITERDHDVERGLSTIHMLNVQKKRKDVNYKITEKDHDIERGLSTIHMLDVQNKRKDVNNKITEKDDNVERGLPRIRMLDVQDRRKDVHNKITEKDHDVEHGLSTIRMIQRQQMANINKFRPKYEMQAEPSVIESLQRRRKRGLTTRMEERETGTRIGDPFEYKNIFNNTFLECPAVPKFEIWDTCEKKQLECLVTTYPKNAFEEMINWTKEGKLWKFPIDNEQGMEREQNIHFSKHVFLEEHLAEWCPNRGPIRHFMELVCVGLSKNPYMTIEEKYDHIIWYKDFFQGKEDLLQQLGLLE